ncbi:hypothetical protein E2C01_030582 [Portunus trituberculatus]|uniref:Uncharacterized protein n=1 Tax=Portunus trituberculatus TaxID=210409 RepID=A0A5B7EVM9_PORTR|nr:hypothetical protein [Portunus trituberculatus]
MMIQPLCITHKLYWSGRQRRGTQKGEDIPIKQSLHYPLSYPNLHPLSPVPLQASTHRHRRANYFPSEIYLGHGVRHCKNPWPERIPL